MKLELNVFWFRRDLRLNDNAGLYRALKAGKPVLPLFIFDKHILDDLENKTDRRVQYIFDALLEMQTELVEYGSSLAVFYSTPEEVFQKISGEYKIDTVFANEDYEPYARERDAAVAESLKSLSISFKTFKDQVIFSRDEVLKDDGTPYTVFTPYSRKWKAKLNDFFLGSYPVKKHSKQFVRREEQNIPSLESLGFHPAGRSFPSKQLSDEMIANYGETRDYPGISGTSRMGVHLRFGTLSIRELARRANEKGAVYLNELIWRDFYQMILWHFPQVGKGRAFKPDYENIQWRNNEQEFAAWCEGRTGYPIVDAGLRQLNKTGYMHNRVRMITASFLAKHLLIDWRWGEAYFAERLLDYELASNNGGWQWAAGCGCDAAPYFRIFNPALQTKRFDPDHSYIKQWVPEFDQLSYPQPIVDHQFARDRCLTVYKKALAR
ncbi:MAG: deoxyribodipyrimidine photo-lyase [Chitinophagaceae bacterium]